MLYLYIVLRSILKSVEYLVYLIGDGIYTQTNWLFVQFIKNHFEAPHTETHHYHVWWVSCCRNHENVVNLIIDYLIIL